MHAEHRLELLGVSLRPELYQEPAYERPGFLAGALPRSRAHPAQQQRRRAALDRLASHRCATAAQQQAAERRALELRRRWLHSRALSALRCAVEAAQQQRLAADRQRSKWLYLWLAACWAAWRSGAARQRHLAAKAVEAAALRWCTLAARALAALQQQVALRAAKRRRWVQAESFAAFCRLVHSLDAWRSGVASRARKQQLLQAAVLHWATRLCCQVLAWWNRHTQQRLLRQRQHQLADDLHRRTALTAALAAWLALVRRLRQLRAAAVLTIEQSLWGSPEQLAKMCLRCWHFRSQRSSQLRDGMHLAARLHGYGLLTAAWRG